MSFFAQVMGVVAEAGLAGLAHSSIAYADPKSIAAQKAKAGSCTPCAIAARRERAASALPNAPQPAPRARPRKVAT